MTATATALPDVDLKLDKDTQFPLPQVGSEFDYTFTISNTGPGTAVNLRLIDILSPVTTYVSASAPASCTDLGSGVVSCSLPNLPNGGDHSFTIRVLLDPNAGPGVSVFNTAITFADNNDPNQANNVDSVQRFTLEGSPPLAMASDGGDGRWQAVAASSDGLADVLSGGMTAELNAQHEAVLAWRDATRVEDAFVIESRSGDGAWVPIAIVSSATKAGVGTVQHWQSKPLPPGIPYAFRVYARSSRGGPWIALAAAEEPLMAPSMTAAATGCIDGQLLMEGRAKHGGAILSIDGLPVGQSDRRGAFHICGMRPGVRTVGAWQGGYVPAERAVTIQAGAPTELPDLTLIGGDINRNHEVDVVDLVLAGAAAGWDSRTFTLDQDGDGAIDLDDARRIAVTMAANPDRLWSDVNGDGAINRTDLVLVGANLDQAGPTVWGMTATSVAPAMLDLMLRGAGNDLRWLRDPLDTVAPDDRFSVQSTQQEDGSIAIEIVATGVRDLYGADIVLGFDPAKVRVLDAQPIVPGAQAELGAVWGDDSFQAMNDAVRARSRWRMVATRVDPAPAIAGERVVLATLRVVPIDPAAEPADLVGAWQLQSARLLDRRARDLGASVSGSTIRVPGLDGRTIWLPVVVNKERVAGR